MIDAIQGFSFAVQKISPKFTSRETISAEHLIIIQKLISLGVIPSYDYEKDLEKLYAVIDEANEAQAEAEKESESEEESDFSLAIDQPVAFGYEMDQTAILNKYLLNIY